MSHKLPTRLSCLPEYYNEGQFTLEGNDRTGYTAGYLADGYDYDGRGERCGNYVNNGNATMLFASDKTPLGAMLALADMIREDAPLEGDPCPDCKGDGCFICNDSGTYEYATRNLPGNDGIATLNAIFEPARILNAGAPERIMAAIRNYDASRAAFDSRFQQQHATR